MTSAKTLRKASVFFKWGEYSAVCLMCSQSIPRADWQAGDMLRQQAGKFDHGSLDAANTAVRQHLAKEHAKEGHPVDNSPLCVHCGYDNDYGSHDALQLTGHLNHRFATLPVPHKKIDGFAYVPPVVSYK